MGKIKVSEMLEKLSVYDPDTYITVLPTLNICIGFMLIVVLAFLLGGRGE